MPTMSSTWPSWAERRLKPAAMATSRASETVAPASTVRMSGRGTITSRTTVSPKSMIEWMSARSPVSITCSSMATSAMASSSESLTPVVPRREPDRSRARRMRPSDTTRTGGKARTAATTGATSRAERSGFCTAQFLGSASASTKMTTTSKAVAAATPQTPSQCSARMPTMVAPTSWHTSTSSRMALRNSSGCSASRTRWCAPRRPSSARDSALAREVRTRLVSAKASRADATNSTTTTPTSTPSTHADPAAAATPVPTTPAYPARRWNRASSWRSRRSIASASASSTWSMPSRCSTPCTTSSASSSSNVSPWASALRAATAGHTTTSPSRTGMPSSSAARPPPGPVPPSSGERPPWSGSSSMGKASTSVGPCLPRNRSLSSAMVGSSTNNRDTSASLRSEWSSSTARASAAHRATSTGRSDCSSATKTSIATSVPPRPPARLGRGGTAAADGPRAVGSRVLVGGHDVGHDLVPDDVALGQVHEGHAVHAAEHRLQPRQSRTATGHVDLGDVPGHHRLGAETDAGEEHLHLLRRRVLRLVEDDEAAVERAPPHERQGCHLDGAPFEQALGAVGPEQVVERVVERAQVGIDLGHDVPGQEAEALTRLDGGAGEDDAVHLACLEGLDRQGHGQVRLAGAGRPDPEGHHVGGDGIGVALLPGRLGSHGAAAGRPEDLGGEHLGRADVLLDHGDGAADVRRVEALALLEEHDQLVEQASHPVGLVALDGDLVAPHHDAGTPEGFLDQPQQLVTLAQQPDHQVVAGNEDLDLGRRHGRSTAGYQHPGRNRSGDPGYRRRRRLPHPLRRAARRLTPAASRSADPPGRVGADAAPN